MAEKAKGGNKAAGKQEPEKAASNTLKVPDESGKSRLRLLAEVSLSPVIANATTAKDFSQHIFGEIDLMEAIGIFKEKAAKVQGGDLADAEAMLMAQASTLDAIFNSLARRAALNVGQHMNAVDLYLRLAMKAQGQCRTTLETLAEIKYPKAATFIRQQNIANQQQVNNGAEAGFRSNTRTGARGEKVEPSNELLTEARSETLDTAGAGSTIGTDSRVGAMAEINRAEN